MSEKIEKLAIEWVREWKEAISAAAPTIVRFEQTSDIISWAQYHLMKLATSDDRFVYLENEFLS